MKKFTTALAALTLMGIIQNAHAEFSQDCLIDNGHENTARDPKYIKWVILSTNPNVWQGFDPRNTGQNRGPFFSTLVERNSRLDPEHNRPQIKLESATLQKDGNNLYLVCSYSVGEQNILLQGNTSRIRLPNDKCALKPEGYGVTCE